MALNLRYRYSILMDTVIYLVFKTFGKARSEDQEASTVLNDDYCFACSQFTGCP